MASKERQASCYNEPKPMPLPSFAAIDFETANPARGSACAVAVVRVEDGRVTRSQAQLLRPPTAEFLFTSIHGITWEMTVKQPTFLDYWPELKKQLDGVDFLAAHNASFDASVLEACCRQAGVDCPQYSFRCTVKESRRAWGIFPTKLPDVCRYLGISLNHHDALSDATACAKIMLEVLGLQTK